MSLEGNLRNALADRLLQAKELSHLVAKLNDEVLSLMKEIQSTSEKTAEEQKPLLSQFQDKQMQVGLIHQTISGISPRIIEMYTLLKISDVATGLEEKDIEIIEKMMKDAPLDLFRVEKGELKIMDDQYHKMVMEQIKVVSDQDAKTLYAKIKTAKI